MRSRLALTLVAAVVVASLVADRGAGTQRIAGTVLGWEPGESITITSSQMDPQGVQYRLRADTVFDGGAIAPGVFVQIWYRSVGERRGVVDRVLVVNRGDAPLPRPR